MRLWFPHGTHSFKVLRFLSYWIGIQPVKMTVNGWFTQPCFSLTLISVVAMYINVLSVESSERILKQL